MWCWAILLQLSFSPSYTADTAPFVLPIVFMSSAYSINCGDLWNVVDLCSTDSCLITYSSAILKWMGANPSPSFKQFPTSKSLVIISHILKWKIESFIIALISLINLFGIPPKISLFHVICLFIYSRMHARWKSWRSDILLHCIPRPFPTDF